MADKEKKEDKGKLCHISIDVVDNGYHIQCRHEPKEEKSLSVRAGWVPDYPGKPCEYVEKTKAAVLKTLAEIL
jgi:hypothetical protein